MTTTNAAQVLEVGFTVAGVEAGSGIHAVVPRSTLRPTSRGKIIGGDERVRHVLSTLDRVARSNCTVLVTGESGTGKELAVAALHDASPRKSGPFVAVNCGAIPAELVESELFGHAKGAFTGAQTARRGFVAAAEGGTLFLDEIGELPLATQVKLLRLFQNREYTPVGETRPIKCDVRIVAATHRNLEEEVSAGRFREDLYFRLNVIHVHLPSLRERNQDVTVLAKHFLKVCAEKIGSDIKEFSDEALAIIQSDAWTGNVRALENAIEHAVLLAQGSRIEVGDLPERLRRKRASDVPVPAAAETASAQTSALPAEGIDLFAAIEHYENNLIRQALERTGGNKNRAAQLLNLNRTTLVEMIKRKKLG